MRAYSISLAASLFAFTVLGCGSPPKPNRGGGSLNQGSDSESPGAKDGKDTRTIGDTPANDPKAKDGTDFFPGAETGAAKKRIFRLTQTQFDETMSFLLPGLELESVSAYLALDPKQTNYDYSDYLLFNNANFTPYAKWVESVASKLAASPATIMKCGANPPAEACHNQAVKTFVHRAFRGAVDVTTINHYVTLFQTRFTETGKLGESLSSVVSAVMMSPYFSFRTELATDANRALLPGEYRQNIAFTLADSPLDELIGVSADKAEAIDALDKALASEKTRAKLQRFIVDWLEIKKPSEMRISKEVFPEFTDVLANAAAAETKAYLDFYLSQPAPKLSEIVSSRKSFVTNVTKALYQADGSTGTELDPSKRFGVFTQPAFIASRSGPVESNIIKRGVFFMRKVMCLETGLTPSGVDTTIPENSGNTERERIEAKTGVAPCLGCHAVINPFGFAFENFDPLGRWRVKEHEFAINPKVSLDFMGEKDRTVNGPVESLEFFTKSDRFQQCFVRQMFRYYMGRNEVASDDPMLKSMFTALKEKDENLLELLRILASSPRFNQRQ